MSVAARTLPFVDLTSVQERILRDLVAIGAGTAFPPGIEARFRRRIEREIEPFLPARPLRLWKERLNEHARCEGLFASVLAGEAPPFAYGPRSAEGTLVHKAIELEIGSSRPADPHEVADRAAVALAGDRQFGPYWVGLDDLDRDGLLMRTVQTLESFRASFPPFHLLRRAIVPVCEHWLEATFGGGVVTVVGKVDLMLNRPDPARGTRVLIDLKTGGAWPDHAEDMRLYALLYTIRYGIPPYRVATLFLRAGSTQAELVTERTLDRAADRVVAAVRTAARVSNGGHPRELRPGPHCGRCPRRASCPALRQAGGEGRVTHPVAGDPGVA